MHNECITELICSFVQELPTSEVKAMYSSCIIELFCLTDAFCTEKKVNAMHNECIMELISSFVQESLKNVVKAMYNLCIIDLFCLTDPFYTKKKVNTILKSA